MSQRRNYWRARWPQSLFPLFSCRSVLVNMPHSMSVRRESANRIEIISIPDLFRWSLQAVSCCPYLCLGYVFAPSITCHSQNAEKKQEKWKKPILRETFCWVLLQGLSCGAGNSLFVCHVLFGPSGRLLWLNQIIFSTLQFFCTSSWRESSLLSKCQWHCFRNDCLKEICGLDS